MTKGESNLQNLFFFYNYQQNWCFHGIVFKIIFATTFDNFRLVCIDNYSNGPNKTFHCKTKHHLCGPFCIEARIQELYTWTVLQKMIGFILHEKFLQFDWLRAVVFQLNLNYLHVKITNLLW